MIEAGQCNKTRLVKLSGVAGVTFITGFCLQLSCLRAHRSSPRNKEVQHGPCTKEDTINLESNRFFLNFFFAVVIHSDLPLKNYCLRSAEPVRYCLRLFNLRGAMVNSPRESSTAKLTGEDMRLDRETSFYASLLLLTVDWVLFSWTLFLGFHDGKLRAVCYKILIETLFLIS